MEAEIDDENDVDDPRLSTAIECDTMSDGNPTRNHKCRRRRRNKRKHGSCDAVSCDTADSSTAAAIASVSSNEVVTRTKEDVTGTGKVIVQVEDVSVKVREIIVPAQEVTDHMRRVATGNETTIKEIVTAREALVDVQETAGKREAKLDNKISEVKKFNEGTINSLNVIRAQKTTDNVTKNNKFAFDETKDIAHLNSSVDLKEAATSVTYVLFNISGGDKKECDTATLDSRNESNLRDFAERTVGVRNTNSYSPSINLTKTGVEESKQYTRTVKKTSIDANVNTNETHFNLNETANEMNVVTVSLKEDTVDVKQCLNSTSTTTDTSVTDEDTYSSKNADETLGTHVHATRNTNKVASEFGSDRVSKIISPKEITSRVTVFTCDGTNDLTRVTINADTIMVTTDLKENPYGSVVDVTKMTSDAANTTTNITCTTRDVDKIIINNCKVTKNNNENGDNFDKYEHITTIRDSLVKSEDTHVIDMDCQCATKSTDTLLNLVSETLYRVESPDTNKMKNKKLPQMYKSKSLDDDDDRVEIKEIADIDEDVSVVTEADVDIKWEVAQDWDTMPYADEVTTQNTENIDPIGTDETELRTFLETIDLPTSPESAAKLMHAFASSNDICARRTKKREQLAQYFLPTYHNPRYLDVISEEGSDISDREQKDVKFIWKSDIMDDVISVDGMSSEIPLVTTSFIQKSSSVEIVYLDNSDTSSSSDLDEFDKYDHVEADHEQECGLNICFCSSDSKEECWNSVTNTRIGKNWSPRENLDVTSNTYSFKSCIDEKAPTSQLITSDISDYYCVNHTALNGRNIAKSKQKFNHLFENFGRNETIESGDNIGENSTCDCFPGHKSIRGTGDDSVIIVNAKTTKIDNNFKAINDGTEFIFDTNKVIDDGSKIEVPSNITVKEFEEISRNCTEEFKTNDTQHNLSDTKQNDVSTCKAILADININIACHNKGPANSNIINSAKNTSPIIIDKTTAVNVVDESKCIFYAEELEVGRNNETVRDLKLNAQNITPLYSETSQSPITHFSENSENSSSSSRGASLCTTIRNPLTSSVGDVTSVLNVTGDGDVFIGTPHTLKELCLVNLLHLPFGHAILQELADVSQKLTNRVPQNFNYLQPLSIYRSIPTSDMFGAPFSNGNVILSNSAFTHDSLGILPDQYLYSPSVSEVNTHMLLGNVFRRYADNATNFKGTTVLYGSPKRTVAQPSDIFSSERVGIYPNESRLVMEMTKDMATIQEETGRQVVSTTRDSRGSPDVCMFLYYENKETKDMCDIVKRSQSEHLDRLRARSLSEWLEMAREGVENSEKFSVNKRQYEADAEFTVAAINIPKRGVDAHLSVVNAMKHISDAQKSILNDSRSVVKQVKNSRGDIKIPEDDISDVSKHDDNVPKDINIAKNISSVKEDIDKNSTDKENTLNIPEYIVHTRDRSTSGPKDSTNGSKSTFDGSKSTSNNIKDGTRNDVKEKGIFNISLKSNEVESETHTSISKVKVNVARDFNPITTDSVQVVRNSNKITANSNTIENNSNTIKYDYTQVYEDSNKMGKDSDPNEDKIITIKNVASTCDNFKKHHFTNAPNEVSSLKKQTDTSGDAGKSMKFCIDTNIVNDIKSNIELNTVSDTVNCTTNTPKCVSINTMRPLSMNDVNVDAQIDHHRRLSLPHDIYLHQMQLLMKKEKDIQLELAALDMEKCRLMFEITKTNVPDMEKMNVYIKSLATLPTGDNFKQKMYDEYMSEVAARADRRNRKVLKLSSCNLGTPITPPANDIEYEFMKKVRERKREAGFDSEESAEYQRDNFDEGLESVLVMDGNCVMGTKADLPKHLREFANITCSETDQNDVRHSGAEQTQTYVRDYSLPNIEGFARSTTEDDIGELWTKRLQLLWVLCELVRIVCSSFKSRPCRNTNIEH